ncbi:lipopolysaccharide heptosyltransferase family protein [Actinobacillus genomosp. 2]|uniref:heptosyltransferase n=1 Tax=Actinobacillus genomosp. 2 TaxID=230709 RepID=UPI002443435B|nr:glycosyltransferase family 9 protein [Actinobacillus genomosp. 2]WGE32719.1 lipopolysaccharide heptosyltransferase family protein [Actinobacillus genomosp. 2]
MKKLIITLFGKRTRSMECELTNIKSVLLKPIGDAIGDAIVHISHLAQIKQAFPQIKTAVLVTERNKQLFAHADSVDMLIDDKAINYVIQRGKWDLYLDFQPTFTSRSIILDALLTPKIIINFGKDHKKHYSLETVKNYDFTTLIPNNTHIADYLHHSVLAPYLTRESNDYTLAVSSEYRELADTYWHNTDKIRVLLNPQGSMREVPAIELANLLNNIDPKYLDKITFLLTYTKSSEQYLQTLNVIARVPITISPPTDTQSYCALVNTSDLVIAVDGGGVHMACAYGKPLLAFYANHLANLARWHPRPKPQVDSFMAIATKETNDNNETKGFNLKDATKWLNMQFAKRIED